MKKKALFFLLFSSSLLFASYYDSNPLSQALLEKDELSGSGYELELDESGNGKLYLDGNVIEERNALEDGYTVISPSGSEEYHYDQNGRLVHYSSADADEYMTYSESGHLETLRTLDKDGDLISLLIYDYGGDGSLLRMRKDGDRYYLLSDGLSYSVEDEMRNVNITPSMVLSSDISDGSMDYRVNEDGSFTLFQDDGESTYSETGLLIRRDFPYGRYIEYSYDGNELSEVVERNGNVEVRRTFTSDGSLSFEEMRENGILRRDLTLQDDGTFLERRFKDDRPYAAVHYDRDRRTILEAYGL